MTKIGLIQIKIFEAHSIGELTARVNDYLKKKGDDIRDVKLEFSSNNIAYAVAITYTI